MIEKLITLSFAILNSFFSTNVHICQRLDRKYGRSIKKDVKKLKKEIERIVKIKCHLEFIRTCLIYNLYPTHVRFKLWDVRLMKQHSYRKFQRRILQHELDQYSKNCTKQQLLINGITENVKKKINPCVFGLLKEHLNEIKEKRKQKIKSIHKKKIYQLSKDDIILDAIDIKKVVYNISAKQLTNDEESILTKGLDFCVETKIKNTLEFKYEIEMMVLTLLKQLHPKDATNLNTALLDCIQKEAYQSLKINKNKKILDVNQNELCALKNLISDKELVIMKANKCFCCVVMDKT